MNVAFSLSNQETSLILSLESTEESAQSCSLPLRKLYVTMQPPNPPIMAVPSPVGNLTLPPDAALLPPPGHIST